MSTTRRNVLKANLPTCSPEGGWSLGKCKPLLGRQHETPTHSSTQIGPKSIPLLAQIHKKGYPLWHTFGVQNPTPSGTLLENPTLCGTEISENPKWYPRHPSIRVLPSMGVPPPLGMLHPEAWALLCWITWVHNLLWSHFNRTVTCKMRFIIFILDQRDTYACLNNTLQTFNMQLIVCWTANSSEYHA